MLVDGNVEVCFRYLNSLGISTSYEVRPLQRASEKPYLILVPEAIKGI